MVGAESQCRRERQGGRAWVWQVDGTEAPGAVLPERWGPRNHACCISCFLRPSGGIRTVQMGMLRFRALCASGLGHRAGTKWQELLIDSGTWTVNLAAGEQKVKGEKLTQQPV